MQITFNSITFNAISLIIKQPFTILVVVAVALRKVIKRIVWGTFVVALIAAVAGMFLNQQLIADFVSSKTFQPSQEVVELEENLNLTAKGATVFLATEPSVETREPFNEHCRTSTHSGDGTLLGCYAEGQIHLFGIDDERLDGIMEVTAAHELLHAVHARMSDREKERFQKKLIGVFNEISEESPDFAERMGVYSHLSQARLANELHSVLGTEVNDLPDWLESHYSLYFEDRTKIVDFFDSYSEVFKEIQLTGQELKIELDALTDVIDSAIDRYTEEVLNFNREWEDFRLQNEAYAFSSNPDLFYVKRDSFDDWRDSIEAQKADIEELISQHDDLREQLEMLNDVSLDLMHVMDSEFLITDN